jgi:hypothetical protein
MALALLAGCASGSDSEPQPIRGAPKEVADTVSRLDRATRARDYDEICRELFTRAARQRAGAGDCSSLMRSAAEGVRRPRIRLVAIRVSGSRARARVRTRAAGQDMIEETIELVRERGRFRIASLAP